MTHKIAHEVYGALIEAYLGFSNILSGRGNNEYSVINVSHIEIKYNVPFAKFDEEDKCLIISINRSIS
ncbi:hypothetical protein HYE59_01150 [Aggregatibacter actinomycetemcomitans]|uniref:hypothetical protein n=1 Tax=Aggregatibacter actinomycetemcomitans TaxID=714 RepID=UPI00197B94B5|nr:hypothetical protein [Aggregatibacter actinomycetemcomitans]MBN6076175.1 hypothetical protein [Aggregatibacter actinomycetemcomitans]